ncbi:hypothetical protein [Deinococcus roseus]|uniref:hypothetical protein n=1 Tax=Deinococcus roseus TaxID=392414 RepID=UPI00166A09CF|nr:hypothetical protein [Deinococcus roseus]
MNPVPMPQNPVAVQDTPAHPSTAAQNQPYRKPQLTHCGQWQHVTLAQSVPF